MAKLPTELTTEVLRRLPAKSVARLNGVSKEWASVFAESDFSKLHCQGQHENLTVIVRDGVLCSLDPDSLDCALRVDHLLQGSDFTVKKVLGCSNGLLCPSVSSADPSSYTIPNPNPNPVVVGYAIYADPEVFFCTPEFNDDIIVICNLSTGARRVVPLAPIDFSPEYFPLSMPQVLERRFSYGFGFDPSSDDYKLVRVSQYISVLVQGFSNPDMLSEVKVYSTKTNSWTRVDHQGISNFCIFFLQESVLVDGALHWLAGIVVDHSLRHLGYNDPRAIVAFNLADSTFHEVPHRCSEADLLKLGKDPTGWPCQPRRVYTIKLSLGAVGGRLCVMCLHTQKEHKFAFWTMEGHGDAKSWEPLASFKLLDEEEMGTTF